MGVCGASSYENPATPRFLKKAVLEEILDVEGILEGCGGTHRQSTINTEHGTSINQYPIL